MKIFFTKFFKAQLKKLKKKFPSVKEDLLSEIENFDLNKQIYIGKSVYKMRIASSDQKRGKSGGFRAYLYFYQVNKLLVPLCIYHKSQKENITSQELKYYFDRASEEF
jgi:hypothetical protein